MKNLAFEDLDEQVAGERQPLQTNQPEKWSTTIYMHCDSDDTSCNLISVDAIKKLFQSEETFRNTKDYTKFCKAKSTTDRDCSTDGYETLTKKFEVKLKANTFVQADLDAWLNDLKTDDAEWLKYKKFLGKKFDRKSATPKTAYLRSIFALSNPIDIDGYIYKSGFKEEDAQAKEASKFVNDAKDNVEKLETDKVSFDVVNFVLVQDAF